MPHYEGLSGIGLINEKHTTVVFDFGSAYTKLGFAGESGPRAIVRSETKCRTTGRTVSVFESSDEEILRHRLVDFIHKLYFKNLLVNPKDRRVVVVESLLCPSLVRNTIAKVLFRHYEVLSIMFTPAHLVALLTLGCSTGLVLDIGYLEATLIPVYEGVPVLHAWQAVPLGSKAIHRSLCEIMLDRAVCVGESGKEERLSASFEDLPEAILEDIKVRACFVTTLERSNLLQNNKYDRSVEPPPPPPNIFYPLSGSHTLTIPGTVREMVTEIMFEQDEEFNSLPMIILKAILNCPIDMRRSLAENLVIMGGTARIIGLKSRLLSEVRTLAASSLYSDKMKINSFKVHQPPAKDNYVAWLGGAIVGATEIVTLRSLLREQYLQIETVPDWSNLSYNIKEERDQTFG